MVQMQILSSTNVRLCHRYTKTGPHLQLQTLFYQNHHKRSHLVSQRHTQQSLSEQNNQKGHLRKMWPYDILDTCFQDR